MCLRWRVNGAAYHRDASKRTAGKLKIENPRIFYGISWDDTAVQGERMHGINIPSKPPHAIYGVSTSTKEKILWCRNPPRV